MSPRIASSCKNLNTHHYPRSRRLVSLPCFPLPFFCSSPSPPASVRFIGSSVHRSRLRILLSNYTVTCNRSCQLAALFFLPECNPFFSPRTPAAFRFDFSPPIFHSFLLLRAISGKGWFFRIHCFQGSLFGENLDNDTGGRSGCNVE